MRILGVDPGSRITGYGCVDVNGNQLKHIGHGELRLGGSSGKSVISFEDRIFLLYQGLSKVICQFQPQVMVVEKVFFAKNVLSALKLGQARGSILLTAKIHFLEIVEYSPTEVKQSVVGHGQADKEQVAKIVQLLIGTQSFSSLDASDGLALAICHAQRTRLNTINPLAPNLQSLSRKRSKKKLSLAESVQHLIIKKV